MEPSLIDAHLASVRHSDDHADHLLAKLPTLWRHAGTVRAMTSDPNEIRDNALRAIELLTAWSGGGRTKDFLAERVATIGNEEGREAFIKSWAGLIEVNGYMLVLISRLTGKSEEEILQTIALHYQGLE
jgi:hypothetical protein